MVLGLSHLCTFARISHIGCINCCAISRIFLYFSACVLTFPSCLETFACSLTFVLQVGLREASGDAGGDDDVVEDPSRSGTPMPDDDDAGMQMYMYRGVCMCVCVC
jgi:hypothetical protein